MKSSHTAGLVASLIGTANVVTLRQPDFLSPFFLQLRSENATFNSRYLFACNTGAATETLCHGNELAPQSAATFTWTSTYAPDTGVLIRNMGLGGRTMPAPMSLVFNPGTNVALSWFAVSHCLLRTCMVLVAVLTCPFSAQAPSGFEHHRLRQQRHVPCRLPR